MNKDWYDNTIKKVDWDLVTSEPWLMLVTTFEGLRLHPYDDQTGKRIYHWVRGATLGFGHLISREEWPIYKDGITEEEAFRILEDDNDFFEQAVNNSVRIPITQYQFNSLVSFSFNVGAGALSTFTLLECVNRGDHDGASDQFRRWKYSQGKPMKGLVRRRTAEAAMYRGEDWRNYL